MPLSHRKLSAWYRQLAQPLEAGLPLADAVRSSRGTGPSNARLETMARQIERNGSFDGALREAGSWLPEADQLFLSASSDAGRMPQTLRNLSARHAQLGTAKLRVLLALAYPVAILHFGLLLLPVVRMIDWEKGFVWNPAAYARGLAFSFLPLWFVGASVWFLVRRGNPIITRPARLLPFVGRYIREQGLADFAFALGNFLDAGVPIAQAWAAAGLTARLPELKAAAEEMGVVIARGEPPGLKLAARACFPAEFVALYRTGELTGHLEENLLRLATQHQEQANRALGLASMLYPALVFLVVAGAIAYQVISIYAGYLKMIGKLGEP